MSGEMDESYVVVIVTYNRIKLLKECMECVVRQSVKPKRVIVIDNASSDGTATLLDEAAAKDKLWKICHCEQNHGGAGGFARGIEEALQIEADWVLVIDDDAMLETTYVEKILEKQKEYPMCKALAGTVQTAGKIDLFHRRDRSRIGMFFRKKKKEEYEKEIFFCDMASFCGLCLSAGLLREIGLPHAEYFIWHDDTEYSIRIRKHSRIMVVPEAVLEHKTVLVQGKHPRRYTDKDYYAIRNRIRYLREHGTSVDMLLNRVDIFLRMQLRNWLFSVWRADGYDWQKEKEIVKRAIEDSKGDIT